MKRFFGLLVTISMLLCGVGVARSTCGDDPNDATEVASVESSVAAQCDCCASRGRYKRCAVSIVRAAVRAQTLSMRCLATVRREVRHACPLSPTAQPCRSCNADIDCDADEFCECRAAGCTQTGGVCTTRPQVCPDIVAPVCGCDQTTYGNDCLRQKAGACKLHEGPCAGTTCTFDGDCDDGNPCTADHCVGGMCQHGCMCVAPTGGFTCCPGPAASCDGPCGTAAGTCAGTCPQPGEVCAANGTSCGCTPAAPACGDTFPTCDGSCAAGSACGSMTGAPLCQCIENGCSGCASCGDGMFFYTCGDPVCGGHSPHDGVPACTSERAGDSCTCLGATCDPGDECNRLLECATSDPTHGGACPISRRAYKTNISYLGASDLQRLHDDLLRFRLASYRYNMPGAGPASHLGFIIDDVEPSPAVNGDTVDLYGYASMTVAALQTQAREIDTLKHEVESLRAKLDERTRCAEGALDARHAQR